MIIFRYFNFDNFDMFDQSKCDWYESGEQSNKLFLNLEKTRASQGPIRTPLKNDNEINSLVEINTELKDFYEKLFTDNLSISKHNVVYPLEHLPVPKLQVGQVTICEGQMIESELLKSLKPIKNCLTKEFYENFWEEIKIPCSHSMRKKFSAEN